MISTLEKLLKQDLKVAEETIKLDKLKKQYVEENREFLKDDIVLFDDYGKIKSGKIQKAYYKEGKTKSLIQYSLFIVTESGEYSKRDQSFYYKFEDELELKQPINKTKQNKNNYDIKTNYFDNRKHGERQRKND